MKAKATSGTAATAPASAPAQGPASAGSGGGETGATEGGQTGGSAGGETGASAVDEKKVAVEYPRSILVTNHGGIALVEPISGAHIQAGGKAKVTFASADHEHNVRANLDALRAANNLPESALEFEDVKA